jgi:hypothetical protein
MSCADPVIWNLHCEWDSLLPPRKDTLNNFLTPVLYIPHLNMELDLQKFIWAPFHVMCTAVLTAETPQPPPPSCI